MCNNSGLWVKPVLVSEKGQLLYKGQNARSQFVRYSEGRQFEIDILIGNHYNYYRLMVVCESVTYDLEVMGSDSTPAKTFLFFLNC